MSGGSYNYLCYTSMPEILGRLEDMERMENYLLKEGYTDIAKDIRRLMEYCRTAENRINVLVEQLEDVFHDIEWYHSGDISKDSLKETLEEYRKR